MHRLHKYTPTFIGFHKQRLLALTEADMRDLHVTAGATKKLLVKFHDDSEILPWPDQASSVSASTTPQTERSPKLKSAPGPPGIVPHMANSAQSAPSSTAVGLPGGDDDWKEPVARGPVRGCFRCGQPGHLGAFCPSPPRGPYDVTVAVDPTPSTTP